MLQEILENTVVNSGTTDNKPASPKANFSGFYFRVIQYSGLTFEDLLNYLGGFFNGWLNINVVQSVNFPGWSCALHRIVMWLNFHLDL